MKMQTVRVHLIVVDRRVIANVVANIVIVADATAVV